jgi:hypothetical protein
MSIGSRRCRQFILLHMRYLASLAVALLQLPAFAAEAPAVDQLISKAVEAHNAQEKKNWKYTYREEQENYSFGKKGDRLEPGRKIYDVIMLEGDNFRKLVSINGRPLTGKEQKQVDKDMESASMERKKGSFLKFTRTVNLGGVEDLPRLYVNTVSGEEVINGRKAWLVKSQPKGDLKPATKQDEEAMCSLRATWIDQETGVVVKERFTVMKATNSFQPGTQLDHEYVQVGEAWLLDNYVWKGEMKPMPMMRGRFETHGRMSEYKRYEVESKVMLP